MATFTNKQFGKQAGDPTFGEANYTWGEAVGEFNAQEDVYSNRTAQSASFSNESKGSASSWSNKALES